MTRRSAQVSRVKSHHFNPLVLIPTFLLGIAVMFIVTTVFSQMNNGEIYSCVNRVNGNVRIVTTEGDCKNGESPLSWNQQGPQGLPGQSGSGNGLPYHCNNCALFAYADKFRGKDFTSAQIFDSEFRGADLTGVIFKRAYFRSVNFNDTNLTNADFSNLAQDLIDNCPSGANCFASSFSFRNANLTNANFSNSIIHSHDFTNANLQNVDFSNTVIRQSKFQGAQNASTANFTGATWVLGQPSTCPDGTNSDENGGTCAGHF